MATNVAQIQDGLSLQEKSLLILEALFGVTDPDDVFRVFINGTKKEGKIYIPLSTSIAGLVNSPMNFKIKVEVREDKTVIYF